jgi:quaternary ammonium compound-resistance protein SugE
VSAQAGWIMLAASGLLDVAWAIATKKADGFRNLGWAAASLVLLALFVVLLTRALQVLPLGVAYAVWVGIGAIGSVAAGTLLFGEPLGVPRIALVAVVAGGIAGLKLTAG